MTQTAKKNIQSHQDNVTDNSKPSNQDKPDEFQGSYKKGTSQQGFAAMDSDKQREISSEGGKAAHKKGTAHEFSSEEAREAGRKGGQHSHGGNQPPTK